MRRMYFLFAFVTILFCSCENNKVKSREDIIKDNLKNYLSDKLNDPDSYEFVSLDLVDSVKYIDNINYRLDAFKKNIEWCKSSDRSEGDKLNEIKKNEWIIEKIDSIKISLGENVNKLLASKYILKFRANNSLGAKIIYSYFLLVDGENKIIQMEDNADRIYILNTISFPGYMELIEKYKKWE